MKAINKNETELCLACLTGKYPLKSVEKIIELEKSITMDRKS